MSEGKYQIIRSESKLSELSPAIRSLYDKKMSVIVARKEEQKAEEEESTQELLETIINAIVENSESTIENAKNIRQILEQAGLSLPEEEEEEGVQEENLEKLTKSLQQSGLNGKMVVKSKRIKIR